MKETKGDSRRTEETDTQYDKGTEGQRKRKTKTKQIIIKTKARVYIIERREGAGDKRRQKETAKRQGEAASTHTAQYDRVTEGQCNKLSN